MVLAASGTLVGSLANPFSGISGHATFGAGSIVSVPRSAVHAAENPSCTEPIVLVQAVSGGVSDP